MYTNVTNDITNVTNVITNITVMLRVYYSTPRFRGCGTCVLVLRLLHLCISITQRCSRTLLSIRHPSLSAAESPAPPTPANTANIVILT